MGEAPPLESARSRLGALPEVLSDEDAEMYWAVGHVDRYAFVLALMCSVADDEGTEDAFVATTRWTRGRARHIAMEEFIGRVRHVWLRERPDINDEAMEHCAAGTEGAMPFTEVRRAE